MTIRSSIFRRLLLSSIVLIGIALAAAGILLTRYTAERERSIAWQQLAHDLRLVRPALASNPPANLQSWAEAADAALDARVTVIDAKGVVLADSRHDPESMENHANRPEVRAALAAQSGSAIRRSATLDVDFLYYAEPLTLPGNDRGVLRLAIPLKEVGASIAAVRSLIFQASAIAALIAFAGAYLLARRFTRRVRRIERYAAELVHGDYSGTIAAEGDDELGSLARSLRTMAEHYRGMLDLLEQDKADREAILGSMVEGVLAVDHHLRITFYNQAFARAVNLPNTLPDGAPILNVLRDPPLRELLARVIANESPARERLSLVNAPGRTFEAQAAPLRRAGRIGAIATFHDITELERLERVRKDFVANISHELRTPLAAIYGFTETLLDGALEDRENSRKFVEIIASHATRLGNLAFDLLTLSEIEAERVPVTGEKLCAAELAGDALHMAEPHAKARDISIILHADEDVHICGQKGRLERAILNLLMNAINYNRPGGEVLVEVRRDDSRARISVTDNGIGIASRDLSRIFERFYRVDKARSRDTGGTGLGLSIVKNTVERAGGSVRVTSEVGKGSTFTLEFPLAGVG